MMIGIIADPENHPDWQAIKAFLEPAAALADREVLKPLDAVWVVYAPEITGAAVACLKADGTGEVPLVGGRDHRRWIKRLDNRICAWMRDEGRTAVRACGRKGWRRVLTDWAVIGIEGDMLIYEKAL